jgi:hypothetical protein
LKGNIAGLGGDIGFRKEVEASQSFGEKTEEEEVRKDDRERSGSLEKDRTFEEICEVLDEIQECTGIDIAPILRASRLPSPMVVPRTDEGTQAGKHEENPIVLRRSWNGWSTYWKWCGTC